MSLTSIIISNLLKEDFVSSSSGNNQMPIVDKVKLDVLNVDKNNDEDYFLNRITYWSTIPFLSRVVILLSDEKTAQELYDYLTNHRTQLELNDDVKINLQENLLVHSKSSDNLHDGEDGNLSTNDLKRFKHLNLTKPPPDIANYQEPQPQKFDAKDMHRLGIDAPQDNATKKRSRSLTKTLYKPDLKLNTNIGKVEGDQHSPTITLDESQ